MDSSSGYLTGKILLATTVKSDRLFSKSVILVCMHNLNGAMGIILNKPEGLGLTDLLRQANIESEIDFNQSKILTKGKLKDNKLPSRKLKVHNPRINRGGPKDTTNGFIIHDLSYKERSTIKIANKYALTATIEILRLIAMGRGPQKSIITLGYCGWGGGQLEDEIKNNMWLCVDSSDDIIFNSISDVMWYKALELNKIPPFNLSASVGTV